MPSNSVAFDRAADYYDETRGFPPGVDQAVADLLVEAGGLTSASRVVEIGIGTGRIGLPLSERVRAVVGLDLSRLMMARLRAKQAARPVYLVQGDATRLPFAPAAFDAALAVHVFHLIPGWQEVLRELARVLRPGAPLLRAENRRDREGNAGFKALWDAWEAAIPPERHENVGVPEAQYATFLADAGWRPAGETRRITFTYYQAPQVYLERMQRRVFSSSWRLSDEEHARGMDAVRRALATHFGDPLVPVEIETGFTVRPYLRSEG